MGIKNLFKVISQNAPKSIFEKKIEDYKNKFVALDANMIIYQYVIAIRNTGKDLTNSKGEITSHVLGVISKSLFLLKNKIYPVFVFDGKPPEMKYDTICKRKETLKKNKDKLEICDEKDKTKYFKRSFNLTKDQIKDTKEILKSLGIPIIEAKSEADIMCAELVKKGLVYGTISEDMDLLTFGSNRLIRKLKASNKKKIIEIDLKSVLQELEIDMNQFIDLCILLGCDYLPKIGKVGLKTALNIIKKYKSIDKFIKNDPKIESGYYKIPENYDYKKISKFFKNPPKNKSVNVKYKKVNYKKFNELMLNKYNFKQSKIEEYIKKFKAYI